MTHSPESSTTRPRLGRPAPAGQTPNPADRPSTEPLSHDALSPRTSFTTTSVSPPVRFLRHEVPKWVPPCQKQPRTPPPAADSQHRWKALVFIALAQLMVVLDATIVNIALPVRPAGPGHLRRQPPVGHHRLRPGLRRTAPLRRPHRRPVGPQAHLRRRSDRLRRRLRARRRGHRRGDDARRPRPPGCLRRAARARRALPARRDVHRRQGARQGVRHLRRDRRWRRRRRPDPRRLPHRVPGLALDVLRQHPVRGRRRRRRVLRHP